MQQIYLASDHGGFALKEKIEYMYDVSNLAPDAKQFAMIDLGPENLNPEDDYPQFAFNLAETVAANPNSLGLLICRSGIGMSIAANKVKGCYAALCFSIEHAKKARQHNHANVLVLDADYGDEALHLQIVDAFLHAEPEAERHQRRVEQIKAYEQSH
jgi:ribose 5-phosphate isomerase B